MPRGYPLYFSAAPAAGRGYAIIGMAHVSGGYPLFYDATNEKGLSAAGLRYPDAVYSSPAPGADNIASFELIPWLLRRCSDVDEALALLSRTRVTDAAFSPELPPSPLHWLVADSRRSIVLEPEAHGLRIYDNPVGVLTNAPDFDFQMTNLAQYMALSENPPENRLAPEADLSVFSRGMGAIGLPGDMSSVSRFVRAVFAARKCTHARSVCQAFHILGSVEQLHGCVRVGEDYEYTRYTSCCETDRGIYHCRTYSRSRTVSVDMHRESLDGCELAVYPLPEEDEPRMLN